LNKREPKPFEIREQDSRSVLIHHAHAISSGEFMLGTTRWSV